MLKFKQSHWMKIYVDFNSEKRIVTNEKDFLKYRSKPTFISRKIFDKNYSTTHEINTVLTLSKPIYVGFTVIELSKWLMYDFHYNLIKKNCC